ncbi:MAG: amidohydrolase, partial [Blastocatellia bacterium]|nr:amidohydrolase [Blastocatellia bacterium]
MNSKLKSGADQKRKAMLKPIIAAALLAAAPPTAAAAAESNTALARIDADRAANEAAAKAIWGFAEVGYQEARSSALLQKRLKDAGFDVKAGVAGAPTAFTATWSNGTGPVIGIMGEYDALPGLSQTADPAKTIRSDVTAGHGCGHHLFGVASASAAIAVRDWMKASGTKGTIRFYGTPAEEGG